MLFLSYWHCVLSILTLLSSKVTQLNIFLSIGIPAVWWCVSSEISTVWHSVFWTFRCMILFLLWDLHSMTFCLVWNCFWAEISTVWHFSHLSFPHSSVWHCISSEISTVWHFLIWAVWYCISLVISEMWHYVSSEISTVWHCISSKISTE